MAAATTLDLTRVPPRFSIDDASGPIGLAGAVQA
jgi:hypothetical protein